MLKRSQHYSPPSFPCVHCGSPLYAPPLRNSAGRGHVAHASAQCVHRCARLSADSLPGHHVQGGRVGSAVQGNFQAPYR